MCVLCIDAVVMQKSEFPAHDGNLLAANSVSASSSAHHIRIKVQTDSMHKNYSISKVIFKNLLNSINKSVFFLVPFRMILFIKS